MITAVHKTSAIEDDQWERVNLLYVVSSEINNYSHYTASSTVDKFTSFYSATASSNKNSYSSSYIARNSSSLEQTFPTVSYSGTSSTSGYSKTTRTKNSVTNYTEKKDTGKFSLVTKYTSVVEIDSGPGYNNTAGTVYYSSKASTTTVTNKVGESSYKSSKSNTGPVSRYGTTSSTSTRASYYTTSVNKSTTLLDYTTKTKKNEGLPSILTTFQPLNKEITLTYKTISTSSSSTSALTVKTSHSSTRRKRNFFSQTKKSTDTSSSNYYKRYVKEVTFIQQNPGSSILSALMEPKTLAKGGTDYSIVKRSDLSAAMYTTNGKCALVTSASQQAIPYTTVTHVTSKSSYKSSAYTINYYNGQLEKTVSFYSNSTTGTSLYSGNFMTYYGPFGSYTQHSKFSKCKISSFGYSYLSYTATFPVISALTTSLKTTTLTSQTSSIEFLIGHTSTTSSYSYQMSVPKTFTTISPEFVEYVGNEKIYSKSSSYSSANPLITAGGTTKWSQSSTVKRTAYKQTISVANNQPYAVPNRPGGDFYIHSVFPNAWVGFVGGNFTVSNINDYYLTTTSKVIEGGNLDTSFSLNLPSVWVDRGLTYTGFGGLSAVVDLHGPVNSAKSYPFTYFNNEAQTKKSTTSIPFLSFAESKFNIPYTEISNTVSTNFGSTTTTCGTTQLKNSAHAGPAYNMGKSVQTLVSNNARTAGLYTSTLVDVVSTKSRGTTQSTITFLSNGPVITATSLNKSTTYQVLVTNKFTTFSTREVKTTGVFETTYKVKVYVTSKIPKNTFVSTHAVYYKDGFAATEIAGGYNPINKGDYSVYLNQQAITMTNISETKSKTVSSSAYTNLSFTLKNEQVFALENEPLYIQSFVAATSPFRDSLPVFSYKINRGELLS